jgi:hypothetical protein
MSSISPAESLRPLTKNVLLVRPAFMALSQDANNKRRTNPSCGVWVRASPGALTGITEARTRIKLAALTRRAQPK